jgi:hypothetical protein
MPIQQTNIERHPPSRRQFVQLQALRLGALSVITYFLKNILELSPSLFWLLAAGFFGIFLSGRLVTRGHALMRIAAYHVLSFVLIFSILHLANYAILYLAHFPPSYDFFIYKLSDSVFIVLMFYTVSFVETWFFWTNKHALTWEGAGSAAFLVWLLKAHRNYHIDAPKQLSALSWKLELFHGLRLEPQHMFIGVGLLFIMLAVPYLILAETRPLFGTRSTIVIPGQPSRFLRLLLFVLFVGALSYFGLFLNKKYSADLSRVTNGVGIGENTKEGESNLGFHSAISPTKQPAALVRLENDYTDNPWAPMLYLREGALSSFNGRELVSAPLNFDTDVPRVSPGQTFSAREKPNSKTRTSLIQSVYFLTKHSNTFAVDYPTIVKTLKNPSPERFLLAYQIESLAPKKYDQRELIGSPVGDQSWNSDIWSHYLRAPGSKTQGRALEADVTLKTPVPNEDGEDLRYLALAKKITANHKDPALKALLITKYLSEKSLYTRKPGHEVTKRGDPVAPYLFSDEMRGYCVHFSHAAVYMMRLLGIPSRIATGYLIDLSYAKDGHILLHLGDRHAWPEVYLEEYGWVVFDVTPTRAENEPELIPDENLLEDLMSKLTPAEVLLEPVPSPDDDRQMPTMLIEFLGQKHLWVLLTAILLGALVFKCWLRYSYLLPTSPRTRALRAYRSFASLMIDLGLPRHYGETRLEYSRRLKSTQGIDAENLTLILERAVYSSQAAVLGASLLKHNITGALASYNPRFILCKRMYAFFNPVSLINCRRW